MSLHAEAWNRLFLLREATADGARAALDRELLLARVAFGDERGLDGVPPHERVALLEGLALRARATPSLKARCAELAPTPILALWCGLPLDGVPDAERHHAVERVFSGRHPAPSELHATVGALPAELRDDAVVTYAQRRTFTHEASEYAAIAAIAAPGQRLRAMADVAARAALSPYVAHAWALEADDIAMRLPTDPARVATSLSEVALLCALAGQRDDCKTLLAAALTSLGRVTTAPAFAQVFASALRPAAMLGLEEWQKLIEQAHGERALFRDARCFLEVRVAAIRALPRAIVHTPASSTADRGHAIDRGHMVMKEVSRRLPDAALELLHHTTIVALLGQIPGRSLDVPLGALRELLKKHPLPPSRAERPPNHTHPLLLEDIVAPLVSHAPATLLALSEAFPRPEDAARWLLAALYT